MSDHDTIIIDEDQNQDFREVDLETVEDPKEEVVTVEDSQDDKEDDYEKVCFICHRPESVAGKMMEFPNNITVCQDCLQKSFDAMSNMPTDLNKMMNMPGVQFLNLSDLDSLFPQQPKIKKKKKKSTKKYKKLDIKEIPAPHKMIGPTGCGKTFLVKTLAKLLDVPLAITDATSLTEAGYIGDDIESVVSKLLAAADNDVERAEQGIIFIDEIDKIAKKKTSSQRDVSGESVQQGMLKLLEGSEVEVPVGANSKNAMVPLTTVNTKNILFICGGAFPDLEEIIKERLTKKSSMGFNAELKDKYDDDKDLISKVTVEDLRKFGMIPEFIGRLPIIFTLKGLDKDMLVKILKEPKNAILKQYQKLLALDEVNLIFDDSALEAIAEKAMQKDTGARALRAIIEEFMLDIMYEIPKDDNIGQVTITREYIEGTGGPIIELRGQQVPRLS